MTLEAIFKAIDGITPVVRDIEKNTHGMSAGVGTAMKAVAGAFTIAAVARFAQGVLDAAGNIVDLASKTGLTTDTIQEMQAVAAETGTTLDAFTSSSFKLGVNIADGGKKARDAIKDLNLSITDLRNASPDEQFRKVVKGLEGIDSQQDRNRIGMALFGKQFSEIAASIEEGYVGIADGASKSTQAQLDALDKAGDAWAKLQNDISKSVQSLAGDFAVAIAEIERGADAMSNWEKITAFATGGAGGYLKTMRETGKALETTDKWLKNVATSTETGAKSNRVFAKDAEEAAAKLKKEMEALTAAGDKMVRWNDELARNAEDARKSALAMEIWETKFNAAFGVNGDDLVKAAERLNKLNDAFRASVRDISGSTLVPLKATVLENLPTEPEWLSAWQPMREGFANVLSTLPQTLQQAFTGGGGLMGAMKAIGVQMANVLSQALMSRLTQNLSSTGGGGAGGAFVAIVLAGVGLAIAARQQMNRELARMEAEMASRADAMRELGRSMRQFEAFGMGGQAQAAWLTAGRANTPRDQAAAMKTMADLMEELDRLTNKLNSDFAPLLQSATQLGIRLPESLLLSIQRMRDLNLLTLDNAALLDQLAGAADVDYRKMEEAAGRYGDWLKGQLGEAFKQLKNNDLAKTIINDFDLLTRGGASVGSVLFGMKGQINDLVNDSLQFGTTIPENMRPWIQNLIDTNQLLDKDGKLIKDIGRIHFADPIVTEFDKIVLAIERLIRAIETGLVPALTNLPRPNLTIDVGGGGGSIDSPEFPGRGNREMPTRGPSESVTISVPVYLDGEQVGRSLANNVRIRTS